VLVIDGGYTQTGGSLNIYVDATDQDLLFVTSTSSSGHVSLGGSVWVRSMPGFEPTIGDRFTFFFYDGGRFGTEFDQAINGTPFPIGFDLEYDDTERSVTAIVTEAEPGPDLRLAATVIATGPGGSVDPGTMVDFVIDVLHAGGPMASSVSIVDTLPSGFSFQTAVLSGASVQTVASGPVDASKISGTAINCTDNAGTVTCPVGNLFENDAATITISALVESGQIGDMVINRVIVDSVETDPIPFDNSAENEIVLGENPDTIFGDGFEI